MHKAAEKLMSQKFKTPPGQKMSVLNKHVQRGLEVGNGDFSMYPAGGKYPDLVEYLKRDPDCTKRAQLVINLLARVTSCVKH